LRNASRPLERREDVDVVELDRGQDRGARTVVEELRALVEVGGVVLVALDHEVRALAQEPALAEGDRHAADEQAGIAAGLGQDVGDQRRGRGLAVGAGDDDAVAAGQELLAEHRRERGQGQAALAGRRDLDVIAEWALPTTTRSGPQSRLAGANPSNTGMPSAAS
jgi:hypothetical protein